jgi:nucleoside-diphosphate-sugar epimerase
VEKKVLLIGGTRYFGKHLVRGLLEAGHRLTLATRGRTPDDFGGAVERLRLDRHDPAAVQAVLGAGSGWDLVYDQMCYSPLDARSASQVLAGRCGRYVMSSTIETCAHLYGLRREPMAEDALDLAAEAVDFSLPWHAADFPDSHYGLGKRQAEAVLQQSATLPFVNVRIAHVLGGTDDFTKRLAYYVNGLRSGLPFRHAAGNGQSSFLNPAAISDFLLWVGTQDFLGPVNAACEGGLSALDLHRRAARLLGLPSAPIAETDAQPPGRRSPFDYEQDFRLSTARAAALGYRFPAADGPWLDELLRQHVARPDSAVWTH